MVKLFSKWVLLPALVVVGFMAFTSTAEAYNVTVKKAGTGTGIVTADVGGITNCMPNTVAATCKGIYTAGQVVVLTAIANAGSDFIKWGSGCATGTGGTSTTCRVSVAKNLVVTFNTKPTLTVAFAGPGAGEVALGKKENPLSDTITTFLTCSSPTPCTSAATLDA